MNKIQNKHLVKVFELPEIIISEDHNMYGEPGKRRYLEEMYVGIKNILKMIKEKTGERHKIILKGDAIYIDGVKVFYFTIKTVNNGHRFVHKYAYYRDLSYVKKILEPIEDEVIMLYSLMEEN